MARINFDHLASLPLCLVGKKALQLGKAPRVHPAPSFTPSVGHSLADMREVLKHDSTAGGGVLHKAFGEDVIVIFSLPKQFSRKFFQVPFGRLGSLLLKLATEAEKAAFLLFPAAISQEGTLTRQRGE